MATVAITGATGFVGSNIAEVLALLGHRVVGLVRVGGDYPWDARVVNFADQDEIRAALAGADAVVHCAIANDFTMLQQDRHRAHDAYVGLTQRVVRAAEQVGARTIYLSSDWVHDGNGHLVAEDMPANPINIYGVLKALSEQVVADLATQGAVVRVGGVMGQHRLREMGPRTQDVGFGYFVASVVSALRDGGQFAVWGGPNVNQIATPSLASEIGAGIGRIISRGVTGTFNLVGDDAVSRLELALATCAAFELDQRQIVESPVPEAHRFPAPVPRDTSMSCVVTRQQLGLEPAPVASLLHAFRREWDSGQVSPLTTD
jgi:dTDP-4-dehydrorhamnose reductase